MQVKKATIAATFVTVAGLVCSKPLAAQNMSRFTFDAGAGFTTPVKDTGNQADTGFNVDFGGGVNLTSRLGVLAEFGFNHFDLNNTALATLPGGLNFVTLANTGVPGGAMRVYSVTLEPMFHFRPKGRFDAYAIGGGGYYRRTMEFTQPAANQTLDSSTQNKAGWNAGAGVEVRVKQDSNAKIYAEARYHYIYTTPLRTTMIPVTFGFRW